MKTVPAETAPAPRNITPYAWLGMGALLLTFGLLLAWAALAPLNSAVVAPGRIVVASSNKVVQHLDGGLVKRIAARDGDEVEAGQLLLALEDEPLRIRLRQVREQLLATEAGLERLVAERDDSGQLSFSARINSQANGAHERDLLEVQQQLFKSRRAAFGSRQQILEQRQHQTRKRLQGTIELAATHRQRLSLLGKELEGLHKLAASQVVSRTKVRELEGRVAELRGELAGQEGEISRLRESLSETGYEAELARQEYRKEVVTSLREQQSRLINLQAEERDISAQLARIEIRAPVAGKIKGMEVVTLGAVVSAGQAIMEIVPRERSFKIDARIAPMDIDSLHPGLQAEVRFPVFDGQQYLPTLLADLLDVSSDVYETNGNNEPYYKASLSLHPNARDALHNERLTLVSGMPVDVIIRTGERTLLDYLVRPFSDMLAHAFNEA